MDNESLLKNNIEERNRIKDEIKVLEEDIFKYQNRGDSSSARQCFEKKNRLESILSDIETVISRLERIIKNDGVDPYAPVPVSNNPNKPTNLPIDDGTITTTMTLDIEFKGTKGKGDNKKDVYQTHTQTVERGSEIENSQIVNQVTNVNTVSSKQTQKKLEGDAFRNNRVNPNRYRNKIQSNQSHSKKSITPRERYEKNKMKLFISNLKKGKSWDQAAAFSQISPTAATKWYHDGSKNLSKNTRYFYNEIKYLEKHNKLNRTDVKKSKFTKKPLSTSASDVQRRKMNSFLSNIKRGFSWEESTKLADMFPTQADTWYKWGSNNFSENTVFFYNQLNKLNISPNNKKLVYHKTYNVKLDDKNTLSENNTDIIDVNVIKEDRKVTEKSKLEHDLKKRIEKLDSIHDDFNNVKLLSKNIDEKISHEDFKSRLQNLINQFKSKKQENIKEFELNEKIILSYGFLDCKTIEDFENKKIQIKKDLKDVEDDIREARLKNKHSIVISLQSKRARYKTQLLDIANIIQLLSKQKSLEKDINEIDNKIKELEKKLIDIQDERKQMDEFLDIYRDAKSCEDAVKLSNIKKQRIVNWIHEGRDRTSANKIYFFNEFNKIKAEKERIRRGEELRKLKTKQISRLLIQLRTGKTKSQACKIVGVNITDFNRWYDDGKNGGSDENIGFYMQVKEIKQMHNFLNVFKKFKSLKKTVDKTDISNEQLNKWIADGKQSKSANAIDFYNKFQKINKQIEKTTYSTSSGTKSTSNKNNPKINSFTPKNSFERKQREIMVNVISEMKKGYSSFEAGIICNIPVLTVKKWYNQGEEGYSENTVYFYKNVNLIELENNELDRMNKIIEEVKKGKSLNEAAKTVNVPIRLVNAWFDYGKNEFNENTSYFYKQIQNENQKEFYKMGLVLDALNNGMSKHDACKIADVPLSQLNSWIDEGRNGENHNAEYFIKEYDKLGLSDENRHDGKSKYKYCSNCGKKVDVSQNYCHFCGYQLKYSKKKNQSIFDKLRGLF